MSKEIDQRVVQMEFDNQRFESNARTTMSTLEKLKEKLNFTGATKGLENVGAAAKNVNMSGLGSAVETVQAKFSALQVMGVTALANITNSAVNAGKHIVSALTIEPITTGFSEYELKMNSVQTIMASTGESLETVNIYLEELNKYADQTIYSFSDMTSNIGKFTNAGVKLEDAVAAIKGVSNVAAVSGANANEASRAMYNFAQALSAGYVKLIDWKSIENANMATVEFKDQLIQSAVELGTVVKVGDKYRSTTEDLNGNVSELFTTTSLFNESLSSQWMTTEVLVKTLGNYADETTEIGKKAAAAATEVKTATQLWDTLKETAQSGWAQTWEIILGDFYEAKELFTYLSETIGGFLDNISKARNTFVKGVLGSKWESLTDKIEEAGISTEDFQTRLKKLAKQHNVDLDKMIKKEGSFEKALRKAFNNGKLDKSIISETLKSFISDITGATDATEKAEESIKDLGDIVNKVIRGDFGNGAERIKKLTEAGYDYATVQNAVNEKLGISKRHISELTEEQLKNADSLSELSDEQLKNKGYTEEQIKAIRKLAKQADEAGTSISDLIDSIEKPSGRELLLESFKNILEAIVKPLTAVKEAWDDAFGDIDGQQVIYNLIEKFHDLTEAMIISDGSAENLKTVFEGLFAAFQIGHSVASMSVIGGLKILNAVLDLFDLNILEVASHLAEYIIKLRDWIKENTFLMDTWDKVGEVIYTVINGIKTCAEAFMKLKPVQDLIASVKDKLKEWFGDLKTGFKVSGSIKAFNKVLENAFKNLESWIKSFEGMDIASIMERLKNSFADFGNDILEACPPLAKLVGFFKDSITYIKSWFSAFKESDGMKNFMSILDNIFGDVSGRFKEAYSIGKNIIEGLVNGLKDGSISIGTAIGTIINGLINIVKTILGIHSPSTVFFAIGGFIIAGLVGGLLGHTTNIKDALATIGDVIIDFFSGLDIGTTIAAGISVGALLLVKKALDIGDKFADAAKNISAFPKALGNLADALNNKIAPSKWTTISNAILKVAIAIGILVAAVILMSLVPADKLWNAVGALAAIVGVVALLAGVMVGLMAATNLVAKGENVGKIGSTLLKIAATVAIMAIVAKAVSGMSWEELGKAGAVITAFGLFIVGLMAATKLISGSKNVDKIGNTLLKIAGAMAIMVIVAKIAASMTWEELIRGGTAIAAFSLILIGLMAATKLINGSKNVDAIGGTLFKIAAAIAIMMVVAKIAASMSWEEIIKGGIVITAFSGILIGLMAATKLINGSKNVDTIGGTLFKIAAAIAVMMIVAKVAASMTPEELVKGGIVIAAFSGILVGLMAATKLLTGSKNVDTIGGTLLKIAGAIAIMMIVAKLAASMTPEELIKGGVAITAFAGIIVGLMAATKLLTGSKNVDAIGNTILKIAGAIAAIGFVLVLLSLVKTEKLLGASVSLALVMGMFALMIKVSNNAKASMGSIIIITVAVGLLAGMIYLLSTLGAESALGSAASISILLLSMAGALALVSKIGPSASKSVGALALMGLVVAELAAILGLMSYFNVSASMENVMAISVLLLAMAGALAILSLIGPSAMTGAGAMAILGLVVGELAVILGLMSYFDVNPSIETAKALSILLASMSGSLILLGVVGMMGPAAFVGIAALATLITAIGGLIVGIGALVSKFPQLETFLDTGMPILEKIGYAIGSFFGNIIGGFAAGALSGLPEIGMQLSTFMLNALPFITGVKMVDESVITGVKTLATAILALTAADLITGIASFISGGVSLSNLGLELSKFMLNAMPFIMGVSLVDPASMEGVKALAETILILTAADVIDGLTSWFTGGTSLASFGQEIAAFAPYIKSYADTVKGIDGSAVEASANAAKTLVELAKALPAEGGLISKITGDNDLATFGLTLVPFGVSLAAYSAAVSDNINAEAISASVEAAKGLVELTDALPASGGLISKITGDNDLATFGSTLVPFGVSLAAYSMAVSDNINAEAISASVESAKKLIEIAEAVPKSGGLLTKITGDNDLGKFGEKIAAFGVSLVAYSASAIAMSTDGIDSSVKSAKKLFDFVSSITKIDNGNVKSFKKAIKSLGETNINDFIEAFSGSTDKITSTGSDLINAVIKGIESKQGSLTDSVKTIISVMLKAINNKKSAFNTAGTELMNKFVIGLAKKEERVEKTMKSATKSAVSGVRTYYDNFYNAGSYLVSGFANGISENTYKATAKAKAMAKAAEKAAKEELDINSPSKVFRKIGMSVPEGFAMGIDKLKNVVTTSSTSMSDTAIYAVQDSISRIADVINTDIDSQPTIRPVLDLSDVSSGARSISGMFAMSPSVGVLANVNSISSSMRDRQNGSNNDDVVAAIKDLRDVLSESSGDSYSFGDITYDDGSNVNGAVKALIGAIRRERRT